MFYKIPKNTEFQLEVTKYHHSLKTYSFYKLIQIYGNINFFLQHCDDNPTCV
jgi:hypothetical protein